MTSLFLFKNVVYIFSAGQNFQFSTVNSTGFKTKLFCIHNHKSTHTQRFTTKVYENFTVNITHENNVSVCE